MQSYNHHSHTSIKKSYGPPRRHISKPYSSKLESIENFKNKIISAEYLSSISSHLKDLESQSSVNPTMIDLQPEVKWFMRPYLVNFIIQMHSSLKLKPSTLFLCWNIIDRYCAKRIAFKQHYQLIGCTALWIASKYEDKKSRVPTVKELNSMCSNVYDDSMFREMEIHILSTLNWSIGHANLEDILQLSVKYSDPDGKELLNKPIELYKGNTPTVSAILAVSRYLCELSLYDRIYLTFSTSSIGITCFLMACSILNMDVGSNYINQVYNLFEHSMNSTKKSNDTLIDPDNNINNNSKNNFEFFTDDDDDTDDNSNAENIEPKKHNYGPFIQGFNGIDSINQIREISLNLFKSILDPSDVLIEKYSSLGVMTVVKRFIEDNDLYQIDLSLLNDNQPENENNQIINPYSIELSNLLLSFNDQSPFMQNIPSEDADLDVNIPDNDEQQQDDEDVEDDDAIEQDVEDVDINIPHHQQPVLRDLSIVSSSSADSMFGTPCESPSHFSSFSSVSSATSYTFSLNSTEYAIFNNGCEKDKLHHHIHPPHIQQQQQHFI